MLTIHSSPHAASQVVARIVPDKADDLLPASKASFEEVRAANAELRASDASLEASNAESVAILEAAEAKLQEIFPVSSNLPRVSLCRMHFVCPHSESGIVNVVQCSCFHTMTVLTLSIMA